MNLGHGSTLTAPRTRHRRTEAAILTLFIAAVVMCLVALCVLLIVGLA